MMNFRVGILTISDKGHAGEREDTAGPELGRLLDPQIFQVTATGMVPDEHEAIVAQLVEWGDRDRLDLILTTGGTGLTPRDITPEATLAVAERLVPGISEAMRAAGLPQTPHAMLSRGVAVTRGGTLIINLPGSPKGARESLEAVLPALPHALEKLRGSTAACGAQ
jgi:molybdopterin adenylyltransferase